MFFLFCTFHGCLAFTMQNDISADFEFIPYIEFFLNAGEGRDVLGVHSNIFYKCLKTRCIYKCNLLYIVLYGKENIIDILLNRFQLEYFT